MKYAPLIFTAFLLSACSETISREKVEWTDADGKKHSEWRDKGDAYNIHGGGVADPAK